MVQKYNTNATIYYTNKQISNISGTCAQNLKLTFTKSNNSEFTGIDKAHIFIDLYSLKTALTNIGIKADPFKTARRWVKEINKIGYKIGILEERSNSGTLCLELLAKDYVGGGHFLRAYTIFRYILEIPEIVVDYYRLKKKYPKYDLHILLGVAAAACEACKSYTRTPHVALQGIHLTYDEYLGLDNTRNVVNSDNFTLTKESSQNTIKWAGISKYYNLNYEISAFIRCYKQQSLENCIRWSNEMRKTKGSLTFDFASEMEATISKKKINK